MARAGMDRILPLEEQRHATILKAIHLVVFIVFEAYQFNV